jgi:hypothetical protein
MNDAISTSTVNRHVAPDKICNHFNTYGLLCDEYDRLRARAAGCCEICQTPEADTTRGSLVIDHFQQGDTWFVRGLVCDRCNGVMARHDRRLAWGPATRPWVDQSAEYHRRSWGATPELLAEAAAHIARNKPWTRRLTGYDPAYDDRQ